MLGVLVAGARLLAGSSRAWRRNRRRAPACRRATGFRRSAPSDRSCARPSSCRAARCRYSPRSGRRCWGSTCRSACRSRRDTPRRFAALSAIDRPRRRRHFKARSRATPRSRRQTRASKSANEQCDRLSSSWRRPLGARAKTGAGARAGPETYRRLRSVRAQFERERDDRIAALGVDLRVAAGADDDILLAVDRYRSKAAR